ncbi:MAG: hypothetical protein J7K49_04990 [Thaumarchaeota archaeon]|nr:hypothetical protein [Nitrososphaerota archaeon]
MDEATLIMVAAALIFVIYLLRKVKLVRDFFIILVFLMLFFAVMAAVPQLRVEPIYSLLKQFFDRLPDWIGRIIDYLRRMLGTVGGLTP